MNEFDEEHRRWTSCLYPSRKLREENTFLIGVLVGEGVGEEVINCAVEVLDAQVGGVVFPGHLPEDVLAPFGPWGRTRVF